MKVDVIAALSGMRSAANRSMWLFAIVSDCRKCAGAPMVAWAAFAEDEFTLLQGELTRLQFLGRRDAQSSARNAAPAIAYRNAEFLPGIVDIQAATLDDPDCVASGRAYPDGRTDRLDGRRACASGVRTLSRCEDVIKVPTCANFRAN